MSEWKPASEMPGGTVTSGTGGLKNMFEREIDKQVKAEAGMNFGPNKCVAFGDKITATPQAKSTFKVGLGYMLNYNHEMAIGTYQQVLKEDPNCMMAWWGIAYSLSSSYNWPPGLGSGHDAIQMAVAGKDKVSELEKDLIDALAQRHSEAAKNGADPTKLSMGNDPALNIKFANAMAQVYAKYPKDLDVAAIYVEGLMNLKPWALWVGHADGRAAIKPADDNTLLAIKTIEDSFALPSGRSHPALCHLYCHALELSPYPEKALEAANTLRKLMPDAGHLVHMPSHIDAWVGQWKEGVACNIDGVVADDKFVAKNPAMESCFYKFYRMHNMQFVVWCAMHTGQEKVAMEYAKKAEAALPAGDATHGVKFMLAGIIPMGFVFLESYRTMVWHVMIRFGKWDDILAYKIEQDANTFASSIATAHYARGIAYASLGQCTEAEAEQAKFLKALENPALNGRVLHNNPMYAPEGPCVFNVQKSMLAGEILYRKAVQAGASVDPAFAELKKAITLSMNLKYNEPWGQMQPIRHALGALLLEQGRADDALQEYEDDLAMWKNNMWGLLGKKQCLEAKGAPAAEIAAVDKQFKAASSKADKIPGATCFCAKASN